VVSELGGDVVAIFTGDEETVLVVDDSDDIREFLSMMLRGKGYRVVEAVNGEEAVELASRVRPRLILMDLGMPVLDGYEATRRIHGRRETRDVPVVAVSGFCDAHNRQKALDAGCVECVCKPVDFGVLDGVLRKHLHPH
jgi:two-component system, cell cycle response regulator DivK